MITVVIPVGPEEHHRKYLGEALRSVREQTLPPSQILIIDDMADVNRDPEYNAWREAFALHHWPLRVWRAPWRLGVATAFNVGVGLAPTEAVVLLGADDELMPTALERAWAQWGKEQFAGGYYYFGVRYMDTEEDQTVPCGAAMVTRGLWRATGGFPIESAAGGAADAALISIMLVHMPKLLIPIDDGAPLYRYRRHENSETARAAAWQGIIIEARGIVTATWRRPEWGRYR